MQSVIKTIILIFTGWVLLIANAMAQELTPTPPPKPSNAPENFTAWNGSFSQSIDIEIPEFRGLTPNIDLTYDSNRSIRNLAVSGGEIAVGWQLNGLAYIERVSGTPTSAAGQDKLPSAKGVGSYGLASMPPDSFTLNGDELVPCVQIKTPSLSPSCVVSTNAGEVAYATRTESYSRVRLVGNTWEVTDKSGTKSVFSTLEGSAFSQTFRWHL